MCKAKKHKTWRSIAASLPVSERQLAFAAVVLDSGNKPLIDAVERGDLVLYVAEGLARKHVPPDKIAELAEEAEQASEKAGPEHEPEHIRQSVFQSGARKLLREYSAKSTESSVRHTTSGEAIPNHLVPVFERASRLSNLVNALGERVRALIEEPFTQGSTSRLADHLSPQILTTLRMWTKEMALNLPEDICPSCSGQGCEICKHGWLSKSDLVRLVPKLKTATASAGLRPRAAKKSP